MIAIKRELVSLAIHYKYMIFLLELNNHLLIPPEERLYSLSKANGILI
jgi:hypothetical protein